MDVFFWGLRGVCVAVLCEGVRVMYFVVGCFHGSVCAGCSVCLCSADDFLWCLMVVVVDWVLWFVLGDLGVFFVGDSCDGKWMVDLKIVL